MNFQLDDDRRMLGDTLERYLADNYAIDKRHAYAEEPEGFSRQQLDQMAELGILGALVSEESGGFGGSGDDLMVVFQAVGKYLVVEPLLPSLLAAICLQADSGQHHDELEKLISGASLHSLAHGEPASRYDLFHVETRAERDGEEWAISGEKAVVLGGNAADRLIVSARTSGGPSDEDGITLFLVDGNAKGLTRRTYSTIDGYSAAEISLLDVHVEDAQRIGGEGEAHPIVERAHAFGAVALCAEALGAMETALDLTVEYAKTRKQFGVPIGKFQALQHRLADCSMEIEQMRSALINAASRLGAERVLRERSVSMAKHMVGTIGRQVAEEAIQIHGGIGMTWEYAVGHYAKRLTMIDHLLGDTDHHLERYIQLGKAA